MLGSTNTIFFPQTFSQCSFFHFIYGYKDFSLDCLPLCPLRYLSVYMCPLYCLFGYVSLSVPPIPFILSSLCSITFLHHYCGCSHCPLSIFYCLFIFSLYSYLRTFLTSFPSFLPVSVFLHAFRNWHLKSACCNMSFLPHFSYFISWFEAPVHHSAPHPTPPRSPAKLVFVSLCCVFLEHIDHSRQK